MKIILMVEVTHYLSNELTGLDYFLMVTARKLITEKIYSLRLFYYLSLSSPYCFDKQFVGPNFTDVNSFISYAKVMQQLLE